MRETERRTEGMGATIDDGRLAEIADGAGAPPTDAEIAAIVRSAVAHCRKRENDWSKYGTISIRRGMQGWTWYEAFKALFRDMKEDPPLSPKDYGSYLVYLGDLADGNFVGFEHEYGEGIGIQVESADCDVADVMNANPEGFTLVPIVVVWDKAVRASEILEDEE